MNKNPTIHEFEALLTTRALSTRMTRSGVLLERIEYANMLEIVKFTCIDLLKWLGIHKNLKVAQRGKRLFLINEFTQKIVAEIGLDFELADEKIKRPKALIISKYRLPKDIHGLFEERKRK